MTQANQASLSQGLKNRHVTMLSIAGAIGAGLFVGSGHAIASAGPAAILAYFIAGTLVVLVMRMLGEMAVSQPDSGSFSTYADRSIGKWAGFTIGWLYWWFWVLVIPFEANAAAAIINSWIPGAPIWLLAFLITAALTVTNLFSVKNYGEFEFWFALIKVVSIIAFIIFGCAAVFGFSPNPEVSGVKHLWDHGGFMPNGWGPVLAALLTTMFSFMGSEIVTIAASESKDPEHQITKATNSVIWRIALFYIVSIFLVIALVPWNDPNLPSMGSYQTVLSVLHVPHAKLMVDIVVLTSVASCLNSALYTASRMVYSLGVRGDAPSFTKKVNSQHTPVYAVLLSTAVAFICTFANYAAPKAVFNFLLDSSGAIALLVYLVIAFSQLAMRKKLVAEGKQLTMKMWCFPYLTWAVIVFIIAALVTMAFDPAHTHEITSTAILSVFVVISGLIVTKRRSEKAPSAIAESK
ncbi:GABA permease [Acinetobacter sp. ANC 3789]|uniref:GABA permease n=1 Tax=Acinetobacter sp. ANC 3789 TaxID=1217714 RepID=UPI0002CF8929|nr:GABA permease [Acinetobacter sp. ANC 3789]ENU81883.1 GABA permease [Acinetobacter sp. ANC 3789]